MPLEDLTPSNRFELALSGDMTAEEASNRIEKILAGADIEPADRLEYFLKLRVSGGGGGGGGNVSVFDYVPQDALREHAFSAPGLPTAYAIIDLSVYDTYQESGEWDFGSNQNLPLLAGTSDFYMFINPYSSNNGGWGARPASDGLFTYANDTLTLHTGNMTGNKHLITGRKYKIVLYFGG